MSNTSDQSDGEKIDSRNGRVTSETVEDRIRANHERLNEQISNIAKLIRQQINDTLGNEILPNGEFPSKPLTLTRNFTDTRLLGYSVFFKIERLTVQTMFLNQILRLNYSYLQGI